MCRHTPAQTRTHARSRHASPLFGAHFPSPSSGISIQWTQVSCGARSLIFLIYLFIFCAARFPSCVHLAPSSVLLLLLLRLLLDARSCWDVQSIRVNDPSCSFSIFSFLFLLLDDLPSDRFMNRCEPCELFYFLFPSLPLPPGLAGVDG